MVHVHPVHPLATPMVSSLILLPVPLGVARFVDLKRHWGMRGNSYHSLHGSAALL